MRKEERISKIREEVNVQEAHYLLLSCPANIQYVCGNDLSFSSRPFYLLVEPTGKLHLFLNELYKGQALNLLGIDIHFYSDDESAIVTVAKMLPMHSRLAVDAAVKLDEYMQLKSLRNDLTITLSNAVEKARVIKDEIEIKCLQQATHYTDTVVSQLKELVHLPSSELSISHQIIALFAQLDIHDLNFDPIVAIGKNAVHPHHSPKEVGISHNEPILVDLGCRVDGYRSDMTRMMVCGGIVDTNILTHYEILKEIQFGAIEMIQPGVAFAEVDKFVRKELKKQHLLEYYHHNLGHGIGLSAYEYPYIHHKAEGVFKENMVVTIGPGIYVQDEYGLRVEDVVHVQKNQAKSLSNLNTNWMKIEC